MLNVKLISLPRIIILNIIVITSINFCIPADPDFKKRPFNNDTYTGFISREFFQAVITVKLPAKEAPLKQLRTDCKDEAKFHKDAVILPILIEAVLEKRKLLRPLSETTAQKPTTAPSIQGSAMIPPATPAQSGISYDENKKQKPTENLKLYRKDFAWFLDSMQLHLEDYTRPDKCVFVFRKIEQGLYRKVEETDLSFK